MCIDKEAGLRVTTPSRSFGRARKLLCEEKLEPNNGITRARSDRSFAMVNFFWRLFLVMAFVEVGLSGLAGGRGEVESAVDPL